MTQAGFDFDAGDPSVGIFGGEWAHVECTDPDGEGITDEQRIAVVRVNDCTIREFFLLTCTDCAKQTIVSQDDYAPTDEAMAEMERQEAEALAFMDALDQRIDAAEVAF